MKITYERKEVMGVIMLFKQIVDNLPPAIQLIGEVKNFKRDLEDYDWSSFCREAKGEIRGKAVSVAWNDFECVVSVNPDAIMDILTIVPPETVSQVIGAFVNFLLVFKIIDHDQIKVNHAAYMAKWESTNNDHHHDFGD